MPRKRELSREVLEEQIRLNPDVTMDQLKVIFCCGSHTIARELKRHGLRTKARRERPLSEGGRRRLSELGKQKIGALNPNFGEKPRPWLDGANHPLRKWHKEHPNFGELQRGDNNPIHKVRHLYEDQRYVHNLMRGIREHVKHKTGKTYEEVYGEAAALVYRERLRQASPARLAKYDRSPTKPELSMRELLLDIGAPFTEQFVLGYYTVDFLVGENLVLQVDGDFWHSNPRRYAEEDLSERQRKQRRLDRSCDSYCRNQGMTVLRVWASDLASDFENVKQIVKEGLK